MSLYELLLSAQSDDESALLELITRFRPLLRKYTRQLKLVDSREFEDAYDDLLADFIEVVHKVKVDNLRNTNEGVIVKYMATSVQNAFKRRKKAAVKQLKIIPLSLLSEAEAAYAEEQSSVQDTYFPDEIPTLNSMTKGERQILELLAKMMSVKEVAEMLDISRQAVNQAKKRALNKIKKTNAA